MLVGHVATSQNIVTSEGALNKYLNTNDVIVVEFWAEWNKHNECEFLKDLEECNTVKADIVASKALADKYNIEVLPTLVIFHNNEEITRFNGNLLFKLGVKKKEVQTKVDSIIISKFQ
tara:strand:+ start:3806 stop:4159 length:354 start_codon:yes stop_codon:yes gene_type:complete